jgi:hypothetical protein
VLPRAARSVVGVEHDVVHAKPLQVVRRSEAGLACTDHHGLVDVHGK